jgi:hypothetical protein
MTKHIWMNEELKKSLDEKLSENELKKYFQKSYTSDEYNIMSKLGIYTFLGKDVLVVGIPTEDKQKEIVKNSYNDNIDEIRKESQNYFISMVDKYLQGDKNKEPYKLTSVAVQDYRIEQLASDIASSIKSKKEIDKENVDELLKGNLALSDILGAFGG